MLKPFEEKGSKVRIIRWVWQVVQWKPEGKRKGRQNQRGGLSQEPRWEALYFLRVFHNLGNQGFAKALWLGQGQVHFGHSTAPKAELISVLSTEEEENW